MSGEVIKGDSIRRDELETRDGRGRLGLSRQRGDGKPEVRLSRGSGEGEWTEQSIIDEAETPSRSK